MKTILGILAIALLSLGAISVQDIPEKVVSFGAPVSTTGAPDERTCAASGCHDTYALNSGRGSMNITVDGAENGIEAGKTYTVNVRVADKDSRRFGFQLVALNDDDKTNAGLLTITEPERTQIEKNELQFQDRKYATYTYEGTRQYTAGVGNWTVQWTAPTTMKNITLYAATVIANDDDTDSGDYVLTGSIPLSPKVSGGITEQQSALSWFATPEVKRNSLTCKFTLENPQDITIEVCDLTGKVFSLGKRHFESGTSTGEYQLPGYATGAYIVRATTATNVFSHTIILR